jgi:preprotein translocase subunit SecE
MASVAEQNARTTTGGSGLGRLKDLIKGWLDRIAGFYNDVRTEMRKVTAPSFKEIQSTTVVVIITVFLFGLYFGIVDWVLSNSLERFYKHFTH